MNPKTYIVGVLMGILGILPAAAFAEGHDRSDDDYRSWQPVTQGTTTLSTSTPTLIPGQKPSIQGAGGGDDENEFEGDEHHGFNRNWLFAPEGTTTPAASLTQLKQSIEERKAALEQATASTSPVDQGIAKDTNPLRLAVHSLLASQSLLDGVGGQVAQIAQHMNDSIATTTVAEAKIQSRGFFTRLFFGGDKQSADAISKAVAQDQQNIDKLTALLAQADISADTKATLEAQIAALKDAQARLQALAQNEQKSWGLFSWRF